MITPPDSGGTLPAPGGRRSAWRVAGETNGDALWLSDEDEGDVRILVLVHRMAALRLGFPDLYSALNDKAPDELKNGLLDGTAWAVRPFIRYLLPLIQAVRHGDDFEVMEQLRSHCPCLQQNQLAGRNVADVLTSLITDLKGLRERLDPENAHTIGEVLIFVRDRGVAVLDERFSPVIEAFANAAPIDEPSEENAAQRFMACPARQLWGYQTYIEDRSPFATQQGIKGAEFNRVLLVIDDEESTYRTFSYEKYFGITQLSETDQKNIESGIDSVVDRTRRLFYVCCSRAVRDLAVVVFVEDVKAAHAALLKKGLFEPADIHLLDA